MNNIDGYWDTEQVGQFHGVGSQAVSRWCKDGKIAAVQLCKRGPWLIRIADAKTHKPRRAGRPRVLHDIA